MRVSMWARVLVMMALASTAVAVPPGPLHARQQASPVSSTTIAIDNFKFNPLSLEIPAGTMVTWTNRDDVPHIVVSVTKKLFSSPALDTNDAFSYTFKEPGTYEYYCSMHPRMTGKVVVR